MKVRVSDNSDAREMLVIDLARRKNHFRASSLANFVRGTIKKRVTRRDNIKRRVNWFFVGATRRKIARGGGEYIQFRQAKVSLVDDKKKKVLGTRIKGVLPREVRVSRCPEVYMRARRVV